MVIEELRTSLALTIGSSQGPVAQEVAPERETDPVEAQVLGIVREVVRALVIGRAAAVLELQAIVLAAELARAIVQVAAAPVLVTGPVAVELVLGIAREVEVRALLIVPVVAREPETVQVEVVPERAPVAGPPKIRSATAAHHHGRVEVPRAAVLAAVVAQTMHGQAATGAAAAWAVVE